MREARGRGSLEYSLRHKGLLGLEPDCHLSQQFRRAFPLAEIVVEESETYELILALQQQRVDVALLHIDAKRFPELTARALSEEDMLVAIPRGHPYADIEAHGFLDGEITRLTELRLTALEARINADLQEGRHSEVVAELDALTVEHPYRESLRALHMLALYRSARQAEALRAFSRTRTELVEGLGIEPSPELQDLQRRILDQDRSLLAAPRPEIHRWAVVVAEVDDAGWRDPVEREIAFVQRESALAAAAGQSNGVKVAPRGTAGYALFREPKQAVEAARQVVSGRTRVAVDFGDLEMRDDEPVGPPLARAARLVAVAHPGQVLLSHAAHEALTATAASGWAAESLGRYDIIGLDPGLHIYQLVGRGLAGQIISLGSGLLIGAAVYFLVAKLLRIAELEQIMRLLRRGR